MNKSIALLTAFVFPTLALAQTGGFVATLGTDTLHVERFVRRGNRLERTIVTHATDDVRCDILHGVQRRRKSGAVR